MLASLAIKQWGTRAMQCVEVIAQYGLGIAIDYESFDKMRNKNLAVKVDSIVIVAAAICHVLQPAQRCEGSTLMPRVACPEVVRILAQKGCAHNVNTPLLQTQANKPTWGRGMIWKTKQIEAGATQQLKCRRIRTETED